MNNLESKIEIMDYVNVLWKKKFFIAIITLAFTSVSVLISFLSPVIWEVETVIMPPEITSKTEEGTYESAFFVGPGKVVARINQAIYNETVAAELNLRIQDLSELKAENIRGTNYVRIYIRDENIEKAKLILQSFINQLKKSLNKLPKRERRETNQWIEMKKKEKSTLEEKLKVFNNNLKLIRKRKNEIEKEKNGIKKSIEELEKKRLAYLKKRSRSESENVNLLLISNDIQNNQISYNMLNELLRSNQMEEKIINFENRDTERLIEELDIEIIDLNNKINRISNTVLVKKPTSSISPVTPKKYIIISIGFLLGFIISIFLAFITEYLRKQEFQNQ